MKLKKTNEKTVDVVKTPLSYGNASTIRSVSKGGLATRGEKKNTVARLRDELIDALLEETATGESRLRECLLRCAAKQPGQVLQLAAKLCPRELEVRQPVFAPIVVNIDATGQPVRNGDGIAHVGPGSTIDAGDDILDASPNHL